MRKLEISSLSLLTNINIQYSNNLIPELYLRQLGCTYSDCVLFTKHYEGIQKFKEVGDLNCILKKKLDKVCFAHNAAYAASKDLAGRTVSGKILKDKAYEIVLILSMIDIKED